MPHFSESELSRLEQAGALLLAAEIQLPVLKTLVWDRAVADEFFKKKEKWLPVPEYRKPELAALRQQITSARKLIAGTSPVHLWLQRYADTTEVTAELLDSVGTADFHQHSCRLYGSSNTPIADGRRSAIELAKRIDSLLSDFDQGCLRLEPPETLTAYVIKAKLETSLPTYFGTEVPEIRVASDMSSKAAAGRNYIKLREDATFSDLDETQLLQHEALIHIATGKNGRLQTRFPLLGESYPGNARTQEGLAVFAEFISGALDPHRFKRLADRVIAIDMAEQGADFVELYQYFRARGAADKPTDAFESAYRVVRGGLVAGGGPFTKDSVYLGGLVEVHSYLRAAVRAGDAAFIRLLFVGKIDLGDLAAMKLLREENLISEPRYIPPWASDLRYLLSYLAYSTFLNEIDLQDVNSRYEDLFN